MRLFAVLLVLVGVVACGGGSDAATAESAVASGLRLQQAGNLPAAAERYEAAILADPQNKLAYYDLGLVLQLQGREADAEVDYTHALALDGNYEPALYNLALIRSRTDPAGAEQLYRKALRVRPNDAAAHYNLGLLLRRRGAASEGDREIALALSLNPALVPHPSPTAP